MKFKRSAKRLLSVFASAAILSTLLPVGAGAEETSKHFPGKELGGASSGKNITIKSPSDEFTLPDNFKMGAYQIFSGSANVDAAGKAGDELVDIDFGSAFDHWGVDGGSGVTVGGVTESHWSKNHHILLFVEGLIKQPTTPDPVMQDVYNKFKGVLEDTENPGHIKKDYFTDGEYPEIETFNPGKYGEDPVKTLNTKLLAYDIAKVLDDNKDNKAFLQHFTDVIANYGSAISGDKYAHDLLVKNYYPGDIIKDSDSDGKYNSGEGIYQFSGLTDGYYLVRDITEFNTVNPEPDDYSYTARILTIVGNSEPTLKSSVPTLTKTIIDEDNTKDETEKELESNGETAVAGVSDVITFVLEGSLPDNYDLYEKYVYEFTDTMSKGLDLVKKSATGTSGSDYEVTVTLEGFAVAEKEPTDEADYKYKANFDLVPGTISDMSAVPTADEGKVYFNYDEADTLSNKITIQTRDLKTAISNLTKYFNDEGTETNIPDGQKIFVDPSQTKVVVTYKAKVNKKAIVNPAKDTALNGNTNEAFLTYSNNPASNLETDNTTNEETSVYTFGIDLTKVDGKAFIGNETEKLSGAQFAFFRKTSDGKYEIAKFDRVSNSKSSFGSDFYNSVDVWESKDITISDGVITDELRRTIIGYGTGYLLTTDEVGKILISGLDDKTEYTLVEVVLPGDGYVFIDPITFTITAQLDKEYTGKIESLTGNFANADNTVSLEQPVVLKDPVIGTPDANGIADMTVVNFKYVDLPSTGGSGVYIYYIAGGALIAGAVVLLVVSKRKRSKTE